jgi:hypothetical protein
MTDEERFNVVVNHAFGGWHHVGNRKQAGRRTVSFTCYGDLSTYDFNVLTKLVLAAHAVRCRVELAQSQPRRLKVFVTCRENKPDSWSEHHPSLDDLITEATKLKLRTPCEPTPPTAPPIESFLGILQPQPETKT